MEYLCTRNLYGKIIPHGGMIRAFTKNKRYTCIGEGPTPESLRFVNDWGQNHVVDNDPTTGAWKQYFVIPKDETFVDKVLNSITVEEAVEV